MYELRIGCVLLAAGNSARFGSNKLTREFQGKTLIRRAMEAVPVDALSDIVVVTQYAEIVDLAKEFGFPVVVNTRPDLGQSHSIELGISALSHCDALMFMVADQPRLKREAAAELVGFYRQHPANIVGLGHNGSRGNPCIFPARFYPELMAIEGDRGGNVVIRQHEEELLLYEVSPAQLIDVDTPQALEALE